MKGCSHPDMLASVQKNILCETEKNVGASDIEEYYAIYGRMPLLCNRGRKRKRISMKYCSLQGVRITGRLLSIRMMHLIPI